MICLPVSIIGLLMMLLFFNIISIAIFSVIFFENMRENVINLPCAEGDRGLITSILAFDKSGQMFSLDRTFSTPETKKGDIGIYKIRKKDYIKL